LNIEHAWAASLKTANAITQRMTPERRYAWAKNLSKLSPVMFRQQWKAASANLKVIDAWLGKTSDPAKTFENFAMTLADFVSGYTPPVTVVGREKAEAARAQGKGLIFLTSHLGNWELGARILSEWNWPATAVYQPYTSKAMQDFIQARRAPGLNYLAVGKGAAQGVADVLRKKEVVALLGDRPFGEAGARVIMCGKEARLPRGPFLFACRFGAPIIPAFVVRDRPDHYTALIEDPLWPEGQGPKALHHLLDRTAKTLERIIAEYADQWYCFEEVWTAPS
jgi:lauroyl/myristoyl acyltransferase